MQEKFENYQILEELGRGTSAKVFLAKSPKLPRRVCIKIFHPALFSNSTARERAAREAKIFSGLKHPNIVPLIEIIDGDPPAIVMEHIAGFNLKQFQHQLPYILPEVSVLIIIEILKALEYAHEKGIIHRDLKPENILVSKNGDVYVSDFGLAKIDNSATITEADTLIGSLDYMSPEQVQSSKVTPASDLFSLMSIFYFLITGTAAFSRGSAAATLGAIKMDEPLSPDKSNPKISMPLSRIIQKGLQKNPQGRYQSARELRIELEEYLSKLGLSPDCFNLRKWMSDPAEQSYIALQTCADALALSIENALKKREKKLFLENMAHLSLKAPASPSIPILLKRFEKPYRRRPKVVILALTATILLLTCGWYLRFGNKQEGNPIVHVPPPPPAVVAAPVSVPQKLSEPEKIVKKAPRKKESKLKIAPLSQKLDEFGEVRFKLPEETEAFIDYKKVNSRVPVKVSAGAHILVINRPGYDLVKAKIQVKPNETTVVNLNE